MWWNWNGEKMKENTKRHCNCKYIHIFKNVKNKNKGITITSLVITVILMLILVSVVVTVAINGGLFDSTKKAVSDTKISNEKSILSEATLLAISKNKYRKLEKETLQKNLDEIIGEGKTIVYDTGEGYEIFFEDSGLYYELDKKGKIGDYKTGVIAKVSGNIFVDEKGKALDGEESPYQIKCIEDLVVFANLANGRGNYINAKGDIEKIENYNSFNGKNIELTRTLNFNSPTSYADLSIKWSYDEGQDAYIIDETSTTNLMEIITDTNGVGFVPIGGKISSNNILKMNCFNGGCHEIQNIYMDRKNDIVGIFPYTSSTIENLGITGTYVGASQGGSIVGRSSEGKILNCYSKVNITGTAGGIIGETRKTVIINCYNKGNISGDAAGGITCCYTSESSIINCFNSGTISASSGWQPFYSNCGGIFAAAQGTVANVLNSCSLRTFN